jgi:hypothetical protein
LSLSIPIIKLLSDLIVVTAPAFFEQSADALARDHGQVVVCHIDTLALEALQIRGHHVRIRDT